VPLTDILSQLRERISGFAASRISRDAAEDLAQEVLMVLHEKYPNVDRLEELLPLSMQIARFKIMSWRNKTYRRNEHNQVQVDELPIADPGESPAARAERRERMERLKIALAGMGDRCRELFRLKLEGHGFPDIQKRMQAASINTVYTWDLRCRKYLLARMGGSWEGK